MKNKYIKMRYYASDQYFLLSSIQQIEFLTGSQLTKGQAFVKIDFIGQNFKITDTKNVFKFKSGVTGYELENEFLEFLDNDEVLLDWTIYAKKRP